MVLSIAAAIALFYFDVLTPGSRVSLSVGDVALQDVLASRSVTYVSEVLTRQAKEAAANAVPNVYETPDARIARAQVEKLRAALDAVGRIRDDSTASQSAKLSRLQALPSLELSLQTAAAVLALPQQEWELIRVESLSVLEQVMRTQVREGRVEEARRTLPTMVSLELDESQANIVATLVRGFVVPNSFYSEAATEEARQAARDAVAPVSQSFVTGQTVIQRGHIVTEADMEALEALGLIRQASVWEKLVADGMVVLLAASVLIIFVRRFQPEMGASPRRVLLYCLLLLLFLLAAKLMVPGHTILPYLFPGAALAMMVAVVYSPHLAIASATVMGALVGYIAGQSFELAAYTAIGGTMASMALGQADRMNSFFWAGLAAAAATTAVLFVFRIPDTTTDMLGLATLVAASLINGGVSASVTLALFFVVGTVFDITTALQLIELSRPNHPLLQFMLREAPGSYQHSLQVANLAEQAAEAIGANPLLIRVGALYHDVGKALHPEFYVENQLTGDNIHERLDPRTSAQIIIGHVHDGLDLARRHRLPNRIRAFIAEHHGTLRTNYQYKRALDAAGGDPGQLNEAEFHYPGPRPQSKETALLMLADGCEAKVRSDRPTTMEALDRIVKAVVDDRMARGELDDTGLTLSDLRLIRQSFAATLKGMFHSRIQYPELSAPPIDEADHEAEAPAKPLPAVKV